MANYWLPTVIQQTIPEVDMMPIERLLLTQIFSSEPDGDGLYFYAEEGPSDLAVADRGELEEVLAASRKAGDSRAAHHVANCVAQYPAGESEIEIDLSGAISWETFIQDIVRRSLRLRYVSVISSFNCSKPRPDGFGGLAVLITAECIFGKSTDDLIAEFLKEAGIDA